MDQIPVSSSPMPLPPGGPMAPDAMAQGAVPPVVPSGTEMSPSHSSGGGAPPNVVPSTSSAAETGDSNSSGGGPTGTGTTDFQSLQPPVDGGSFVIQKIKESMQEEAKRFSEESTRIDQTVETVVEKREYY